MKKRDELSDPRSCINKARDDEWTFVLLGRDVAAPDAIRYWAERRVALGKNRPDDPQIVEALECAARMEAERVGQPTVAPQPPKESKAQRIAAAIHERIVIRGMPLGKALAEVKREFEGPRSEMETDAK